jgi:hypothetical protein
MKFKKNDFTNIILKKHLRDAISSRKNSGAQNPNYFSKGLLKFGVVFIFVFVLVFSKPVLAVGAAPGKFEIYFEPNLETEFKISVRNIQEGTKLSTGLGGDLMEYANVSNLTNNNLIVHLSLPGELKKPGENILYLSVTEVPIKAEGSIMAVTAVRVPIIVKVPFLGRYLDVKLDVQDAGVGEKVNFKITAENLGSEFLDEVDGRVKIYGPDEKLVDSFSVGKISLDSASKEEIIIKRKIKNGGAYLAVVELNYGEKVTKAEAEFKIGTLFMEVVDYTKWFKRGQINPFSIEVKNNWNNLIPKVYADILIEDRNGNIISEIQTPSIDINAWETKTLTGLFDATNLGSDVYQATLTFNYADKTNKKVVGIKIGDKPEKFISPISLAYIVFLFVSIITYFLVRRKKMRLSAEVFNNGF